MIQQEIDWHMEHGVDDLLADDIELFNMQLTDLNTLDGEDHYYWLFAMKAAQQDPWISADNDYTQTGVD